MMEVVQCVNVLVSSGTSWVEVSSPVKEVEALHVSVGVSVVWVVTKDFKVSQSCIIMAKMR